MPFRNRRARSAPILVLTLASLVLATLGLVRPATAADTATRINITDVITGIDVPERCPGPPAPDCSLGAPTLFLVAGVPFDVKVTFTASDGTTLLPISVSKAVTLRLTTTSGPDAGKTLGSVVAPKGATSATIVDAKLITAANSTIENPLKLSVSGEIQNQPVEGLQSGESVAFDALKSFVSAPPGATRAVIGPRGRNATTCQPTATDPTCAELFLSNPATSNILLSLGSCEGLECDPRESVVQALFATPTPVTLVYKCDKTLCGNAPPSAVVIIIALTPGEAGVQAPVCPAKNTLGNLDFCVDDKQSTKDNFGDVIRTVLLRHDLRAWHG